MAPQLAPAAPAPRARAPRGPTPGRGPGPPLGAPELDRGGLLLRSAGDHSGPSRTRPSPPAAKCSTGGALTGPRRFRGPHHDAGRRGLRPGRPGTDCVLPAMLARPGGSPRSGAVEDRVRPRRLLCGGVVGPPTGRPSPRAVLVASRALRPARGLGSAFLRCLSDQPPQHGIERRSRRHARLECSLQLVLGVAVHVNRAVLPDGGWRRGPGRGQLGDRMPVSRRRRSPHEVVDLGQHGGGRVLWEGTGRRWSALGRPPSAPPQRRFRHVAPAARPPCSGAEHRRAAEGGCAGCGR